VVDPPHPEYVIDDATAQRFQTSASLQRNWNSVTVSEWLQNAAWWLLKVFFPPTRHHLDVWDVDFGVESDHVLRLRT
jgi:hypothetical protein